MTSKGPTILGLPSLKDLKLVTQHCAIQKTECVPVNSALCGPVTLSNCTPINLAKALIEAYLEQFNQIGHFAGEYHPIVHAPRKYPIPIRDEIKAELDEMMSQGIIHKVIEPSDWVSSIVYVCKNYGKLQLCLDPKDLNKVMCCHHKTLSMEVFTQTVQLDQES